MAKSLETLKEVREVERRNSVPFGELRDLVMYGAGELKQTPIQIGMEFGGVNLFGIKFREGLPVSAAQPVTLGVPSIDSLVDVSYSLAVPAASQISGKNPDLVNLNPQQARELYNALSAINNGLSAYVVNNYSGINSTALTTPQSLQGTLVEFYVSEVVSILMKKVKAIDSAREKDEGDRKLLKDEILRLATRKVLLQRKITEAEQLEGILRKYDALSGEAMAASEGLHTKEARDIYGSLMSGLGASGRDAAKRLAGAKNKYEQAYRRLETQLLLLTESEKLAGFPYDLFISALKKMEMAGLGNVASQLRRKREERTPYMSQSILEMSENISDVVKNLEGALAVADQYEQAAGTDNTDQIAVSLSALDDSRAVQLVISPNVARLREVANLLYNRIRAGYSHSVGEFPRELISIAAQLKGYEGAEIQLPEAREPLYNLASLELVRTR